MLTESNIEGNEIIQRLYSEVWFMNDISKEIYIRYYSMPFDPQSNFYIPGIEGDAIHFADTQFKILVAKIADQKYESNFPSLIKDESGYRINIEKISRILPTGYYVLISTPIQSVNEDAYKNASLKMDGLVGILRLVGGNNLLFQLVREGKADISNGILKSLTSTVPFPQIIDGPFATILTWKHFKEITDSLNVMECMQKKRIELAIQLTEKAFLSESRFKFFSYWVALEVAADTHITARIVKLLSKYYDKSGGYIKNELGFNYLIHTRNAIVHEGEVYEIPASVERYLQNLMLDVIRAELGLKCNEYMVNAIRNGFDVKMLDKTMNKSKIMEFELPY